MFSNMIKGIKAWKDQGLLRKGPWWKNARMVFADVPVEYDVVKEWVPFPLRLAKPAMATVFFAHYPECIFGDPYYEVGLMLHVRLFGIFPKMLHCSWMLVDDDLHLINGRELLGYPKKMATFQFEEKDGKFFGAAFRRGSEVFRIEGTIGKPLKNPKPGAGQWWVNLRCLLTLVFPGQLIMFKPIETVHEANEMNLTVTLTPSWNDPLCRVTGLATNASIRTCDMAGNLLIPPLVIWLVNPFFQARLMHLRTR
ncbi:MAG: acetoacetate decarboxylase family protein [Burkholderiales bacterium]